MFECVILVQLNVSRSTTEVFVFVSCHINNFVSYLSVFNNEERRFYETVIVNSCVSCK